MDVFGKYKKYIDDLTAILDASSEIIFLCNNFDITRIQDLFINIIENYNYYEEGKNDTSQTERLGGEISGSAEYIKMKEYIDTNFKNIEEKCECFTKKLEDFITHNLPNIDDTQDGDDALIRDNFKSQYKTIRINLEDIERELSKIKQISVLEITAIKDDDIQFNIFPITKSNMMYTSSLYSSFKMIFKNLQIINSNENEITEEELEEINNDLKKLYINLIEKFNHDTINDQETKLKEIIAGLNNEGILLKDKYDSYIKKGGDVKGEVDEGQGEEGEGEGVAEGEGEGEEGNGKGNVEGKEIDDEEGNGENVKKLEEKAERLTNEAAEAKKKADELASIAKLNEGKDEEEQLKNTEGALVAATAAHDAALKAHSAKKAVDKAKLAAAAAAEEDAKKKAEEANKKVEEAKKRAAAAEERKKEEAAEEERKKEEAAKKKIEDEEEAAKKKAEEDAKKKDKEAEDAKKKADEEAEDTKKKTDDEAEAAKKKADEDPLVFNFEYNQSSCYVNSALQMLIDNEELCDKIINAANTQTFGDTFNGDKTSDRYLLYLLDKIIQYHRGNRHSIGEAKKPSYNEYILPLREYLNIVDQAQFKILDNADPSDLFEFILRKLENLKINKEYDETKLLFLEGDEEESFDKIIKYQKPPITSNKENLIFKIGRSRSKRIPNTDKYLKDKNNKPITEEVTKSITLSPKLILGEDNKNSTYILKGFIHFVPPGHYIYYKSLNNSKNEWVILDDLDAKRFPVNDTEHKVDGHPLGKNGNKILQKDVKTTGSTLFYYKKEKDDTTLNASQVGVELLANAGEDDPDLQAALAASLEDQNSVANTTGTPFKYSFEESQIPFTPIYNTSNKPYYLEPSSIVENKEKAKQANFMASLNAGDQRLYVGGNTINGEFNKILGNNQKNNLDIMSVKMHLLCYMQCFDVIKDKNEIVNQGNIKYYLDKVNDKYDLDLTKFSTDSTKQNYPGKLHYFDISKLENEDNTEFTNNMFFSDIYLYISETRLEKFKEDTSLYPGDVFIDILKKHPYNFNANAAMIYCVGPDYRSYPNEKEEVFTKAVKQIGINIATAILKYNSGKPIIQKIDYARICLISGGQFAKGVDKSKVAEALIVGIHFVNNKNKVKDIVYNFAYDDDAFQKAFNKLKANDPVLASAELIIT